MPVVTHSVGEMDMKILPGIVLVVVLLGGLLATTAAAQKYEGTIAVGGIVLKETGDPSTTVEAYNIFDGFSVSQLRLTGNLNPHHTFALNLREVNLDSRKGEFVYRMPGRLRFNTNYDQWRQLFDSNASITSSRKDWRAGLNWVVGGGATVRANYKHTKKTGARLSFPSGTQSVLGNQYDFVLQTGMVEAEMKKGSVGFALAYNFADFDDRTPSVQDRFGQVVSARIYGSAYFWPDKLTHFIRASLGRQETSDAGINLNMKTFQYTGVVRPHRQFQFKYNFHASQFDDDGTGIETDNYRNNFLLNYYHNYGQVYGGYGYEANDNDLNLTNYNTFIVGASGNYQKKVRAKIEYGSRAKEDVGQTTLLKDIESNRFLASLRYQITKDLNLGGKITQRVRKFTTIGVESEGQLVNVFGTYEYPMWASVTADYSYMVDDFDDLVGTFKTTTHMTTARLQIDRVENLRLVGGITYLDIGEDLNIEKSIMWVEGKYTLENQLFFEAKYNVYNYDDYVILSRYYTANAVWLNIGYNFKKE